MEVTGGIKAYGTLYRDNDTNTEKIVKGSQVEGGYFVCEALPTSGAWQTGQLCYVNTGTGTGFYQYDGDSRSWEKANLGGGAGALSKRADDNPKVYLVGVSSTDGSSGLIYDSAICMATANAGRLQAASFAATSDARLKENFEEYTPQKSILDLPIYKFDFINGSKNNLGCKAQDLQEICPEIVFKDSETGYLSIAESKIVFLLIDEIKKLKAEIENLKR